MDALTIARRLIGLGAVEQAQNAYLLAASNDNYEHPEIAYEAALYLLSTNANYKLAYTMLVELYRRGYRQSDIYDQLVVTFYAPNVKKIEQRYKRNLKYLTAYEFCFTKDFPSFEELPIRFFPYDEGGYIPFDTRTNEFLPYFNSTALDDEERCFFGDLSKPFCFDGVYRQHELEYLYDNVRRSEWIAKDNHVYLCYDKIEDFCSYLCAGSIARVLPDKKLIFLFGEEKALYPIDFKEKYGIDYSENPIRPLGVREINRVILLNQLSTHNGLDFFHEVLDGHPNLLSVDIMMHDAIEAYTNSVYDNFLSLPTPPKGFKISNGKDDGVIEVNNGELIHRYHVKKPTKKDAMIAFFFFLHSDLHVDLDELAKERIAPALFFSPHFHNANFSIEQKDKDIYYNRDSYNIIANCEMYNEFRYIKSFSPIRRTTSSMESAIRFSSDPFINYKDGFIPPDGLDDDSVSGIDRCSIIPAISNQTPLGMHYPPSNPFFRHSRLVRFEDGKLNPKATFSALARFLDIPYSTTMESCSIRGVVGAQASINPDKGFDTAPVFRYNSKYLSTEDQLLIEKMLSHVYAYLGYDPLYYDKSGQDSLDKEALVEEIIQHEFKLYDWQREVLAKFDVMDMKIMSRAAYFIKEGEDESDERKERIDALVSEFRRYAKHTFETAVKAEVYDYPFYSLNGERMKLMKLLTPDEDLLVAPIYRK